MPYTVTIKTVDPSSYFNETWIQQEIQKLEGYLNGNFPNIVLMSMQRNIDKAGGTRKYIEDKVAYYSRDLRMTVKERLQEDLNYWLQQSDINDNYRLAMHQANKLLSMFKTEDALILLYEMSLEEGCVFPIQFTNFKWMDIAFIDDEDGKECPFTVADIWMP